MKNPENITNYLKFTKSMKDRGIRTARFSTYWSAISRMERFLDGKEITKNIHSDTMTEFCLWMERDKIKVSSIRQYIKRLENFLDFMVASGEIEKNVMKNFRYWTAAPEKIIEPFSKKEIDTFLMRIRNKGDIRAECWVLLMLGAGMRVSEVARLKVEDIDFKKKTISVTNKGSVRVIGHYPSLDPQLFVKLLSYMESYKIMGGYMFLGNQPGEHIYKGTIGTYLHSHYTFRGKSHIFRHTGASWILKSSGDLITTQKFLGHRNLITTFNYVHKIKDEKFRFTLNV